MWEDRALTAIVVPYFAPACRILPPNITITTSAGFLTTLGLDHLSTTLREHLASVFLGKVSH